MAKRLNYYRQIIQKLENLHKAHPTYNMGRHLSTALDDSDLWGVSDKELLSSLQKYETELEMDVNHVDDEELDEIIKGGMNLEKMFSEEEEDEDY